MTDYRRDGQLVFTNDTKRKLIAQFLIKTVHAQFLIKARSNFVLHERLASTYADIKLASFQSIKFKWICIYSLVLFFKNLLILYENIYYVHQYNIVLGGDFLISIHFRIRA